MPRWKPIELSGKQIKAMDRVGGAELSLPWPPSLLLMSPVNDTRDATAEEHRVSEELVGPACRDNDLVPIRSFVRRNTHRDGTTMINLVVLIISRRWVHASTNRQPAFFNYFKPVELLEE